jgi:hypothetical protein
MRGGALAVVAVATMLTFTSCASPYDQATKDDLREGVIAVSQASAAGDWLGAIARLDELAAEVSAAREAGKVDDARFDSIVAAMELVRADLDLAVAAAEDEAERQRLLDEQARLQEQITQLQNQGNGDDGGGEGEGEGEKKGDDGKKGEGEKKGEEGKG